MRSGSSLTRVLLSQHESLFGTLETHWFTPALRTHWSDESQRRVKLLKDLVPLTDDEYSRICQIKKADPDREFIDIVMSFAAERARKTRWVDKTPDNIEQATAIRETWPRARLVHVTREYKDVFASWKHKRGDNLETFLAKVERVYDGIADRLATTTSDYMEIEYEDLALRTEATMRRLVTFVGEPWDPACAAIDLANTTQERKRVHNALGQDNIAAAELTSPISTSSIGQWRTLLTAEEARTIERRLARYYDIFSARWTHA